MPDLVLLLVATAAAAVVYRITRAGLFNPAGTIDPWLYTALWTNFDQIYGHFSFTYYAARLPWIVPGRGFVGLLGYRNGSLAFHAVIALGGALLVYRFFRQRFGIMIAVLAYVSLLGNQMYYNANRWDYEEGGVITFLVAAVLLGLPRTQSLRLRAAALAGSGFFTAALLVTRIPDVLYLAIGLPLLYAAEAAEVAPRERLRRLGRDVPSFVFGFAALIVAGGIYASVNGAKFFFFEPEWQFASNVSGAAYQLPIGRWLPNSPNVLTAPFVALLALLVLATGRPRDRRHRRLLIASTAWLALSFAAVAVWEFAGSGWILAYSFYWSSFLVPIVICLGCTVGALLEDVSRRFAAWGATALCVAASFAPVVWVFRSDVAGRVAVGYGSEAYLAVIGFMAAALALTIVSRLRRTVAVWAATAAALAAFGLATASSFGASLVGISDPAAGDRYALGQGLVGYLRERGYRTALPYFWLRGSDARLRSLQSLHFSSWTYVGLEMPTINADFRNRMALYRPRQLVFLCESPSCEGGAAALGRAGLPVRQLSRVRLSSGSEFVWVEIYRLLA